MELFTMDSPLGEHATTDNLQGEHSTVKSKYVVCVLAVKMLKCYVIKFAFPGIDVYYVSR